MEENRQYNQLYDNFLFFIFFFNFINNRIKNNADYSILFLHLLINRELIFFTIYYPISSISTSVRDEVKSQLFDILSSFQHIKKLSTKFRREILVERPLQSTKWWGRILDSLDRTFELDKLRQKFDTFIEKVQNIVSNHLDLQPYDINTVKTNIFKLISDIELHIKDFKIFEFPELLEDLHDFSFIKEFILINPLNLNQNWIIANCYLCQIDILVNNKRIEYNLIKEEKRYYFISILLINIYGSPIYCKRFFTIVNRNFWSYSS